MHELTLCRQLLKLIEQQARHDGFTTVKTVTLKLGILAGVDKLAFEFAFFLAVKQTCAQHANLIIIDVPAIGYCKHCKKSFPIKQLFDPCKQCHHYGLDIIQGQELLIHSLEVE